MFHFEKWSQDIYKVIDLMEEYDTNNEEYLKDLKQKWDELFAQENDEYVLFLKHLLKMTKEVLNGEEEKAQLEKLVNDMRSSILIED